MMSWLRKLYKPAPRMWFSKNSVKVLNISPDKPDERDYDIYVNAPITSLINNNSLKQYCPPVKNQGWLGSCCSHAYCTALEILHNMNNDPISTSELFHYYMARKLENSFPKDSGMQMRTGAKVLNKFGVCFEEQIPYILNNFNSEPSWVSQVTARFLRIKHYYRCTNYDDIVFALNKGFPVCIGLKVDKSFLGNKTGFIDKLESHPIGGHAMCAIGSNSKGLEIVNSWGTNWGNKGFAVLSPEFVNANLIDAWALEPK